MGYPCIASRKRHALVVFARSDRHLRPVAPFEPPPGNPIRCRTHALRKAPGAIPSVGRAGVSERETHKGFSHFITIIAFRPGHPPFHGRVTTP